MPIQKMSSNVTLFHILLIDMEGFHAKFYDKNCKHDEIRKAVCLTRRPHHFIPGK